MAHHKSYCAFVSSPTETTSHHPDKNRPSSHSQVQQPASSSYLDCNRVDCSSYFKAPFLEHHHRCIIYTGACPEDKIKLIFHTACHISVVTLQQHTGLILRSKCRPFMLSSPLCSPLLAWILCLVTNSLNGTTSMKESTKLTLNMS